jgi:hypothetical protein
VVVLSSTKITAKTPAHAAGVVNVQDELSGLRRPPPGLGRRSFSPAQSGSW